MLTQARLQEGQADALHAPTMAGAIKVMERMSSQVQQLEIAMDLAVRCLPYRMQLLLAAQAVL